MRTETSPSASLATLAPSLAACLGEYVDDYRATYRKAIEEGRSAKCAARELSRAYDGLLGALYCAADAASVMHGHTEKESIALVAVGGYGRELVGLHSDVDLLFLCDDPASPKVQVIAEALLYPLWDIGMEIGHAVRGVEETLELARTDARTATTLFDARHLAGNDRLVRTLRAVARRAVTEAHLGDFLSALEEDTRKRHERFGDSLHRLEPDVKLGRGGLRDLDVAGWALCARWNVRSRAEALTKGVLSRSEAELMDEAQEFLWQVRSRLHMRAGRRQDRLTFADQEELAYAMGFEDGLALAVEQFMQTYYRHAGVVARTSERIVERAKPAPRRKPGPLVPIGQELAQFDGTLTFRNTSALERDPMLALRLYDEVLQSKKPPYGYARDAVVRGSQDADWCRRLRENPDSGPLFVRLLTAVERSGMRRGSLPSELHAVGLTLAMVPEMEPLVGRVIHDVYHVYTFDVHCLRALDRLRALARGKRFEHLGLARRLAAEMPRRAPVHMAAFLHALGWSVGRESESARLAAPVVARLGFSGADQAHILWLLETRTRFLHWATERDMSDESVLEEIAAAIGSRQRLRDLYLLTVSVLSTTNPTALNSWKARLIDDLYFALATAIDGESLEDRASDLREEVARGFVGDEGEETLRAFVDRLPDRYLLANDADAVRRHARTVRDVGADVDVALALGPGPSHGVSELVLYGKDRPGLLANLCGVLSAHAVGIVGAQIYTMGEQAFDVLWVRRAREGRPTMDGEASRLDQRTRGILEESLRAVLRGERNVETLLEAAPPKWSQRKRPHIDTTINVDNQAAPTHSVIDVFTRERVGVLHCITRTLHAQGLAIDLAKVNTEGARVADVFYVREADGSKIAEGERATTIAEALNGALDALDG